MEVTAEAIAYYYAGERIEAPIGANCDRKIRKVRFIYRENDDEVTIGYEIGGESKQGPSEFVTSVWLDETASGKWSGLPPMSRSVR